MWHTLAGMSDLAHEPEPGRYDPEAILQRLPASERELFLSEYRSALDEAHEVWRYRQLQDALSRWNLIAVAASRPGYALALADASAGTGQYTPLEDVAARQAQWSAAWFSTPEPDAETIGLPAAQALTDRLAAAQVTSAISDPHIRRVTAGGLGLWSFRHDPDHHDQGARIGYGRVHHCAAGAHILRRAWAG